MGLKINGSTSGSIEIDVPAVAGTDTAITIPATTGGEFIVSDASGNIDLGALDISGSAAADSVNIDASGRLLVGTTSATDNARLGVKLGVVGTSSYPGISITGYLGTGGSFPILDLTRSRGTTDGSYTKVESDDILGRIHFRGSDGTNWKTPCSIEGVVDGDTGTDDMPGRLVFSTTADGSSSPTERMKLAANGRFFSQGIYDFTSASSANCFVASNGNVVRSTSSAKYKTSVEDIDNVYSDALLQCRPVWYRSTSQGDNPDWGWWGFIAEEVAAIDPRLVHWKTIEVTYDENGSVVETPCDPEPEGVAYDRFVPHLLNLIKRQKEQIESQAAQLASLEARLTALEGGAS